MAFEFRDHIRFAQIAIANQIAEPKVPKEKSRKRKNNLLELTQATQYFQKLSNFPYDERLDKSRASLAKDVVSRIDKELAVAAHTERLSRLKRSEGNRVMSAMYAARTQAL